MFCNPKISGFLPLYEMNANSLDYFRLYHYFKTFHNVCLLSFFIYGENKVSEMKIN